MKIRDISHPASKRRLLVLLHAGFLLIGIITVLLGQILPVLSKRLNLNDSEAGYLFIAQFVGSLTGTIFYNRLIKRFGYLPVLAFGCFLMAAGGGGLNFDSKILTSAAIFLYGSGIGLTIPAFNLLIVKIEPERSSSALNIINFFWGVGAILCKPYVDYAGSPDSILTPTVLLSILFFLIGLAFVFSNFKENFGKPEIVSEVSNAPIWTTSTAWLIAAFNFVHIGIESSAGGWLTTYQSRMATQSGVRWLSAALIFFLFLLIGRGLAPLFLRVLSENTLIISNLLIITVGIILILRAENFPLLATGAGVLGIGTSSVFPTNMSRFTKIFGARAIGNATPLFIAGSLGGAFSTWLVGFTSNAYNSLRAGFLVVLISSVMLIILQIILTAAGRKKFSY